MTPEEKAKELVLKFYTQISGMDSWYIRQHVVYPNSGDSHFEIAKQCALIAVEECLKMFEGLYKPEYVSFDIYEPKQYTMEDETDFNGYTMSEYWQQVKEAINNI